MDYKGHICPVCNKAFEKGDDVVVCPICGTPHHRDCYDEIGHCKNMNRHRENYDYKRECEVNAFLEKDVVCPHCQAKNPYDSRFCNSCGKPVGLPFDNEQQSTDKTKDSDSKQDGFAGSFVIDPLGGVKPDEEVGDGVKASEAARFVKASTPFYIPQFRHINRGGKARFSFVGFIFCGGWMLYRKMYKLGIVITVLFALLTFAEMYTNVYHTEAVTAISEAYTSVFDVKNLSQNYGTNFYSALGDFFGSLNTEQLIICISRTVISVLTILLRVICGVCGNRWYYKHSIKSISKIKNSVQDTKTLNETLSFNGGVNVPLAISLIASYYIIIYLPVFI